MKIHCGDPELLRTVQQTWWMQYDPQEVDCNLLTDTTRFWTCNTSLSMMFSVILLL